MFRGIKFVGDDQLSTIVKAVNRYQTYIAAIEDRAGRVTDIEIVGADAEGVLYRLFNDVAGTAVGDVLRVGWMDPAFVFLHIF